LGSTVNANRPNFISAFQSPDMGELPVETLLVEGVGRMPGTYLRAKPGPQARGTVKARKNRNTHAPRLSRFIVTLLLRVDDSR
jgi:hypothetical protein